MNEEVFSKPRVERAFASRGYPYRIYVGALGAYTAYVGVPAEHPWYGLGYFDPALEPLDRAVHGGLTYAEGSLADEQLTGYHWLGWDYAHAGDYVPVLSRGRFGHGLGAYRWSAGEVEEHCWAACDVVAAAERIARLKRRRNG